MKKSEAFELLSCSLTELAELVGVTPSAVSQWPEVLTDRLADRVLAVLARRHLSPELVGEPPAVALPLQAPHVASHGA
jgi:DNA-binding transcriptional regulator YdaS (Cro superfamily)